MSYVPPLFYFFLFLSFFFLGGGVGGGWGLYWSLFWYALFNVLFSFAIILMSGESFALTLFGCLVTVNAL